MKSCLAWPASGSPEWLLTSVMLLSLVGCAPMDSSAGSLLSAHEGGVRSQSVLDGVNSPSTEVLADSESVQKETAAEPEPMGVSSASLSAETAEASSPQPVETSSPESPGSAGADQPVASEPAAPVVIKSGDADLDSGEYVPSGGLVLQAPLPIDAEVDARADVGSGSELSEMPSEEDSIDEPSPPPVADALEDLLEAPSTDQVGLDALASLPPRVDSSAMSQDSEKAANGTETLPCLPVGPSLLTTAVRDLSMVRAWVEGGELRGELRDGEGRLYPVVQGDRVGADGGRVVRITRNEIVIGAIGFDLEGRPVIVQEVRRLAP
ncbi:MAG TPA: hypothetical protein DIU15_01265 [Deltaproteobacteria bacterium]|nr:hypothetical protein [Deltaproteobacteria bacterium]